MAKLRPAKCHRRLKRAFTRTSKYRKKSYIRAAPNHKIIHFDSGNKRYEFFPSTVTLYAKKDINLRHNAIEAARIAVNRYMNKVLGKEWQEKGWIFKQDPLGWFQWYCRFSCGRRIFHIDEIQIKRWKNFRRHVAAIKKNCESIDLNCRRKQRQAILQWAYNPFI